MSRTHATGLITQFGAGVEIGAGAVMLDALDCPSLGNGPAHCKPSTSKALAASHEATKRKPIRCQARRANSATAATPSASNAAPSRASASTTQRSSLAPCRTGLARPTHPRLAERTLSTRPATEEPRKFHLACPDMPVSAATVHPRLDNHGYFVAASAMSETGCLINRR